ncbi:hypothetical protein BBJ28_00002178 [Nothophytophthora sp. Chile5]|nr:hypothetical protein BBJ28_00002178 [Nothophytophthora sp. Chile5]
MVQRASQQYLECRRSVTAKVDEVKQLDEQIAAVFQQISALSEAAEDGVEPSEEAKAAAKSVGRLEVTLMGVEGEEPVPNAAITVALDPEYEADEYETVEEVVEKRDVVVTDEHGHVVENGASPEEDGEHTPRKLKTTTKITRTVIKKRVKKEKAPVVRTVAWTASTEGDEDTETSLAFPSTFVFDPVQSREAIVTITVAAASARTSTEDEEEEEEPVKEIEFSIASLFQGDALERWYTIVDEEEAEDVPTTITEVVEETEDVPTTITEVVDEQTTAEETATQEGEEAAVEETEEAAEKAEEGAEEAKEADEKAEEAAEEAEKVAEEAEETVEKAEEAAEETEAKSEVEEVEETEEAKPVVSRFHVTATFVLSEAEKLSISAVTLSKQKQETEAALQMLEREAASLRTKYERLNASQRQMNASSISKPKSSLLGGRFGAGAAPVPRKSQYQKLRESVSAVLTPPRQQLLISLAMFAGSVCLFHFNGDNLLA